MKMGGRYGGGEVWEELEGGNRSEYDQNTVCMSIMKFPIYKYEYIRKEYSNREKSIQIRGMDSIKRAVCGLSC